MVNKWSISWRLSLLVLVGAGTILSAVSGYGYFSAKHLLEEELMDDAHQIAMTVSARVETSSRSIEGTVHGLAAVLETVIVPDRQSYNILEQTLDRNADMFGAAIALIPADGGEKPSVVPYVYRTSQGLQQLDLGQKPYQFEITSWYVRPIETRRPIWSEPYFDENGGNILMATYSVPLFKGLGKETVRGVVTGDLSLENLSDLLVSLELGQSNYAFIISGQGRFIAHPINHFVNRESIFRMAESRQDAVLRDLGQKMISGQRGLVSYTSEVSGKPGWVAYVPIPSTGWSLGIFFSREELMAKVFEFNRVQWYLGITGFLLLCIVVMGISRSITKPIRQLEKATRNIAAGDFAAVIPAIPGDDEVAHLAEAFTSMISELKNYMEILRETTTTQERIASELRIANSIQMGLIPNTFPPFPDKKEFELFALLEPAREVGGDFYDFFFLDEKQETLWLVIGDAADKGIGAALFMAITRTLLRAMARENQQPAVLVSRLNEELSSNNESCMFITLFCASVHLPTGRCRYANGGHCPPVIIKQDGSLGRVPEVKGAAVGGMAGMVYSEGSYQFMPGEVLFLYTDGVSEAANKEDVLFGEERLQHQLLQVDAGNMKELLYGLRHSVENFAGEAEQSDDITMLAFRYIGTGERG